jgi:hypothetical protein
MIKPRLRELYAPETEEDAERELVVADRWHGLRLELRLTSSPPLSKGGQGGSGEVVCRRSGANHADVIEK